MKTIFDECLPGCPSRFFTGCNKPVSLKHKKGYEKSLEFDHTLMENVPVSVNSMIAGNIKYNDNLDKFMKICKYIDISGGVETSGLKDISKVKIFLDNVKKLND